MKIIKDIGQSLLFAFVVAFVQKYLETRFLIEFLESNLITILVALLAINSTTQSLILSKLRDIIGEVPVDSENQPFKKTRMHMMLSMYEHIILIILSVILFLLLNSPLIQKSEVCIFLLETLVFSCFAYSLIILLDNVKSVFIILDFKSK